MIKMGDFNPKSPKIEENMPKNKEFLYVGHYIDTNGNYMLKIGTTNDLNRRQTEHTRNYRRAKQFTMPSDSQFVYDFYIPLSKYNTLRYEDKTRAIWQNIGIGEFVRNDRFRCDTKPEFVEITIRKTYKIPL